jgi:hypothetical protein
MAKDCKEFIKTCHLCQVHKSKAPPEFKRPLRPSLPEGPNCRISIDLIGPLDLTTEGYQYTLVMIDYFTKWAVVAPLKTKTGEEVAEAIYLKWYCTFGIPYEIQTDQGNEFTNIILAR